MQCFLFNLLVETNMIIFSSLRYHVSYVYFYVCAILVDLHQFLELCCSCCIPMLSHIVMLWLVQLCRCYIIFVFLLENMLTIMVLYSAISLTDTTEVYTLSFIDILQHACFL